MTALGLTSFQMGSNNINLMNPEYNKSLFIGRRDRLREPSVLTASSPGGPGKLIIRMAKLTASNCGKAMPMPPITTMPLMR